MLEEFIYSQMGDTISHSSGYHLLGFRPARDYNGLQCELQNFQDLDNT